MAVSMRDVARHAGVSQRTVSNVVNDYEYVSEATRARVRASLQALGYRPNLAARQLRRGRTGTVTLAIPNFRQRYFADLAEALINAAAGAGLRVLVETTDGDHDREVEIVRGGAELLTDGVILSAVALGRADDALRPGPAPIVLVGDRDLAGPIDHVDIPNRIAAAAAVDHLVGLGRSRVMLLGALDPEAAATYALRREGFDEAIARGGLRTDPALVLDAVWTQEDGERRMDAFLASGTPLPDALFAMNDALALGAIRSLLRHDVRVPQDVAVVGFDDTQEARHAVPSLTSIAPALPELAETALRLLAEQLGADRLARTPEHAHVSYELRVRESTVG